MWAPNWGSRNLEGLEGSGPQNLGGQNPKFRVTELKFGNLGHHGPEIWGFQDADSWEETLL